MSTHNYAKNFKTIMSFAAATAMTCSGWAYEMSSKSSADGSWKIDVNATANLIAGHAESDFDDLDVNVDRPFVMVRVTSPGGRMEFEGVFNTQALISRDSTLNDVLPESIIQELKLKYAVNPMISVTAGHGSIGFGAGLEDRGERADIPLLSEQAQYSQIKNRLMAEVGLTLQTGTTVQLAVFDGREPSPLDPDADLSKDDFIQTEGSFDRLKDDPSFAAHVQQQVGSVLGNDVAIIGSYAKIANLTEGATEEQRAALGAKASRQVGNWTISALYQFVKVWDNAEVQSHLAEIRARHDKTTLFAKIDSTTNGGVKKRSVVAGASYALVSKATYSVSPFVAVKGEKTVDQDEEIGWGTYLGTNIQLGRQSSSTKKTE